MAPNSLFFFRAPPAYDEKAVRKHVTAEILPRLTEFALALRALNDWSAADIHDLLNGFAVSRGLTLGKLAQPIAPRRLWRHRVAAD